MSLADKKCVPCRGGVPPLTPAEAGVFLKQLSGWRLDASSRRLSKDFKFKNFTESMALAVRIGALADAEGHHPDLHVAWGCLGVELWTHKIDGLTESDFILAAKIDALAAN